MACVVLDGRPLIGIIHRPFIGDTHWAIVGYGTSEEHYIDRKKEGRTTSEKESDYRFIISRSHSSSKTRDLLEKAYSSKTDKYNHPYKVDIVEAGGAGYKALAVINGSYDAYVHWSTIKMWDICAAEALVTAVGGQATDMQGNPISYDIRSDEAKVKTGFLLARQKHSDYLSVLTETIKEIERETAQQV